MAILIVPHAATAGMLTTGAVAAASQPRPAGMPWFRRIEVTAPALATLVVFVGYVVSVVIWRAVRAEPLRVGSDFSVFALLYIAAQATERVIEPLASFLLTTDDMKGEMETALAGAMNAPGDAAKWGAAAEAKERLDQRQRARAYVLWAAATVVGMLASASIGVYLIAAVTLDQTPSVPVDILVTGLVIGGGTKPLHDLIARIESAKEKAGAPGI
jgi:hypothetical protein